MMKSKKTVKTAYTMRSAITESKYVEYKKTAAPNVCPLCDGRKVLRSFWMWDVVENHYPYDRISNVSHILITRKHKLSKFGKWLADMELYWRVLPKLRKEEYYTNFVESVARWKTVPGHHHWHLLKAD